MPIKTTTHPYTRTHTHTHTRNGKRATESEIHLLIDEKRQRGGRERDRKREGKGEVKRERGGALCLSELIEQIDPRDVAELQRLHVLVRAHDEVLQREPLVRFQSRNDWGDPHQQGQ
jgi:hypothetical protein